MPLGPTVSSLPLKGLQSPSKLSSRLQLSKRYLKTRPSLLVAAKHGHDKLSNSDYSKTLEDFNLEKNLKHIEHVKKTFLPQVRKLRLQNLRKYLMKYNCSAGLFHDPCHIRYACDASNMTIWHKRNQVRYLLVPATENDPVILFESLFIDKDGVEPLLGETINKLEPNIITTYSSTGTNMFKNIEQWADQIDSHLQPIVRNSTFGNNIAVQGGDPLQAFALEKKGYILKSGQQVIEHARSIKVENEIELIKAGIQSTADAVAYLHSHIGPGITENALWAKLHEYNIAVGGEYIETRLLNSGMRTSPWMQESSTKIVENGELVALDVDCTGPFGYFIDFSRTWLCSSTKLNKQDTNDKRLTKQRDLHKYAKEQMEYNMSICKAGMSFRELSEKCWKIPNRFSPLRYGLLAHGNGINGEYPYIYHDIDFEACGYDGEIQENMTLSFEAFIAEDQKDGVKLEEHCLISTEKGVENLSYMVPFCDHLS